MRPGRRTASPPGRQGLAAALGVALVIAAMPSRSHRAQAFACAAAASPAEKALCASPEAKASDEAMGAAFGTLKASLDTAQAKALLANQRGWLRERNAGCADAAGMVRCLTGRNRERVRSLLATPGSGPGTPGRLVPVFVARQGNRTDYGVDVLLYRFAAPDTPGEKAFDAAVDRMLAEVPTKKDEPDDLTWTHERTASIAYASDRLLSVAVTGYDFTGGAHGQPSYSTINVDLRSGRTLDIQDLLDSAGLARAFARCMVDIAAAKKERDADMADNEQKAETEKGVRSGLANLSSWQFGADRATVTFEPYALGSYAEGSYTCALPYAELKTYARSPFPLPAP